MTFLHRRSPSPLLPWLSYTEDPPVLFFHDFPTQKIHQSSSFITFLQWGSKSFNCINFGVEKSLVFFFRYFRKQNPTELTMTFFSIYMNKCIIKFPLSTCPLLCISPPPPLPHTYLNSICWSYCAVVGQHCHSGFLVSAGTFLCAVTLPPPTPSPPCPGLRGTHDGYVTVCVFSPHKALTSCSRVWLYANVP